MDFLNDININELSTSGVIALVLIVLTVVGFIRGAVKLLFLLFSLAGAGYAAYWGAEVGFVNIQESWAGAPAYASDIVAFVCGLAVFVLLTKIFGFFTDPFESSGLISSVAFGIPAAAVSLVAAIGLVWGSLLFLKSKGAESEIRYWLSQDDPPSEGRLSKYPTLANIKQHFEESIVGKKVMSFYKVEESEKHNLVKLLVMAKTAPQKLMELTNNQTVQSVLNNPKMQEMLKDPTISQKIQKNDSKGLLEDFNVNNALLDGQMIVDLDALKSEDLK